MRESFVFYRSFYEAIDALPEDKQLKLFKMICELGLNNLETTEQDKIVNALFTLIEPQIKANNRRYENGKKGGAPKGNTNAKKQPKNNQKQPNVNVNDNVNVNVNDNDNIYIVDIIDYLNQKTNSKYKTNTRKTISLIKARLKEKYTIDDFKLVIDKKCKEWLNTEMEKYLRPETLFGTKFESYLNQKEYEKPKSQMEKNLEFLERMKNNG